MPPLLPAGMPTVTLTDLAALRVQTISFFLGGLLLAAWGLKAVWNELRRDFPNWPRLTYRAAVGATLVWGLLFLLVLTMIAGARELLTPGAWKRDGLTSKLDDTPANATAAPPNGLLVERRSHLEALGRALLADAAAHGDRFPQRKEAERIDDALWRLPQRPASFYRYLGDATAGDKAVVIAFEPALYDGPQLVLFADGGVRPLTPDELAVALPAEEVERRTELPNRKGPPE